MIPITIRSGAPGRSRAVAAAGCHVGSIRHAGRARHAGSIRVRGRVGRYD